MRARLLIFINPESDPFGEGYNILQAKISIGSGGLLGRGLMNGTQTQLRYLRVSHSDFIFSVLAEELGFAGVVALFLLLCCCCSASCASPSWRATISAAWSPPG